MADFVWNGAASTDCSAAGNYVGGVAPGTNGDNVDCNILPTNPMTTGTMPVNLGRLKFTDAYGNNPIGTISAGLTLKSVTTLTIGCRATFVNLSVNNALTIGTLNLDMPNGCTAYLNGAGTYTLINVSPGITVVGNAALITGINSTAAVNQITLASSGTALSTFAGSAYLSTARTITAATATSGSTVVATGASVMTALTLVDSTFMNQSSAAQTAVTEIGRSFVTPMGNPNITASITALTVFAGSTYALTAPGVTMTATVTPVGSVGGVVGVPS